MLNSDIAILSIVVFCPKLSKTKCFKLDVIHNDIIVSKDKVLFHKTLFFNILSYKEVLTTVYKIQSLH
jgi:hypothetical protein